MLIHLLSRCMALLHLSLLLSVMYHSIVRTLHYLVSAPPLLALCCCSPMQKWRTHIHWHPSHPHFVVTLQQPQSSTLERTPTAPHIYKIPLLHLSLLLSV